MVPKGSVSSHVTSGKEGCVADRSIKIRLSWRAYSYRVMASCDRYVRTTSEKHRGKQDSFLLFSGDTQVTERFTYSGRGALEIGR